MIPSLLRSRIGMMAATGIFLIPLGMSSLRGLTHVLTCSREVRTPFLVIVPAGGEPVVTTSARIEAGGKAGVCGGLMLDMAARLDVEEKISMVLPITNTTDHPWRGTVRLAVGETSVPVDIGIIDPGATETDTITLKLGDGIHEVNGSLLIGP
ncbi:MAG: hypothetical protein ACRDJI_08890 [Actinomycetota bacterium]